MTITNCASCSFVHRDRIYAYAEFVSGLEPSKTGCDSLMIHATPGMLYYQWNNNTNNDVSAQQTHENRKPKGEVF